jgi:hypothetical protein
VEALRQTFGLYQTRFFLNERPDLVILSGRTHVAWLQRLEGKRLTAFNVWRNRLGTIGGAHLDADGASGLPLIDPPAYRSLDEMTLHTHVATSRVG